MTKETMIANYRKFSAAKAYMLGFEYKKNIYMIAVDEIMPRWVRVEKAASKNGGGRKLQLRIHAADRDMFLRKGAKVLCSVEELPTARCNNNKGVAFECAVSEHYGVEFRGKESIGFWHDGDLTVDGVSYQIKINGAQIVAEETLETLKEFKRLGVTPPEMFNRGTKKRLAAIKAERKKG